MNPLDRLPSVSHYALYETERTTSLVFWPKSIVLFVLFGLTSCHESPKANQHMKMKLQSLPTSRPLSRFKVSLGLKTSLLILLTLLAPGWARAGTIHTTSVLWWTHWSWPGRTSSRLRPISPRPESCWARTRTHTSVRTRVMKTKAATIQTNTPVPRSK